MDWLAVDLGTDYRLRTKHWKQQPAGSFGSLLGIVDKAAYPLVKAGMVPRPDKVEDGDVEYSFYTYNVDGCRDAFKKRTWVDAEAAGHLYVYPVAITVYRSMDVEPAADLTKEAAMRLFAAGKDSLNVKRSNEINRLAKDIEGIAAACDADLILRFGDAHMSANSGWETGSLRATVLMYVSFLKKA